MKDLSLIGSDLEDLITRLRPVLAVVQNGRRGAGAGVLAGEGLILTNFHVVARKREVYVTLDDNDTLKARILSRDPHVDLALLQIPANGHRPAIFSTADLRPGELVFAFGHPWGQRNVLTAGVLSAVTSARTKRGEIPVLRTDARLAPGNSGGPLLNAAGEVIGLNAMIVGGDQSIAIPTSVIKAFMTAARKKNSGPIPEGIL